MNKGTARNRREPCLRQGPSTPEDSDEQCQGCQSAGKGHVVLGCGSAGTTAGLERVGTRGPSPAILDSHVTSDV